MAICNRDLDVSGQKEVLQAKIGPVVTGASVTIVDVPSPCTLRGIFVSAFGLSGAPQWNFEIQRFAGGVTTIDVSASNMIVQAFGTSGVVGHSGLVAAGSSLLSLLAGDKIQITSSVANTAVENAHVGVVVQKVQDFVSQYGLTS